MLEEQERAMQADDDDFFEFRRKEERRGWFRRNKKQEYSSKLEKWEVCEVHCIFLEFAKQHTFLPYLVIYLSILAWIGTDECTLSSYATAIV